MSSYLISDGYLTAGVVPFGEQWMKMRKVLSMELLSLARHRWLHDKRAEEADHVVRYIYNQCGSNGGLVNVRFAAQHYGGNMMRHLMFGKRSFGKQTEDGGPGAEDVDHLQGLSIIQAHLYAFCVFAIFERDCGLGWS